MSLNIIIRVIVITMTSWLLGQVWSRDAPTVTECVDNLGDEVAEATVVVDEVDVAF